MEWFLFALAATVVLFAGRKLTHSCYSLSQITNIGHLWLGAILLSTVTSLPELSSTLAAGGLAKSPELAIGNIFGSNLINIAIIALLWLLVQFPQEHTRAGIHTGMTAVILSLIFSFAVMTPVWEITIIKIHPLSLFIMALFLVFFARLDNKDQSKASEAPVERASGQLGKVILQIVFYAAFIIAAGILLSIMCDHIADNLNLNKTFAGTLFLAVATSLPELVVTATAIRAGFAAMAAGNIFGSSCFNLFILALADFVYRGGNIFQHTGKIHLFQINASIMLTLLALLVYYTNRLTKTYKLIAFCIILLYLFALWIIYRANGTVA